MVKMVEQNYFQKILIEVLRKQLPYAVTSKVLLLLKKANNIRALSGSAFRKTMNPDYGFALKNCGSSAQRELCYTVPAVSVHPLLAEGAGPGLQPQAEDEVGAGHHLQQSIARHSATNIEQ